MWLARIRRATSEGARACIVIVLVVAAVNLWKLAAGFDSDPVLHRAGLSVSDSPGVLPGEHSLEPSDGFVLQALGRTAADSWLRGDVPYWNRFEGVGAPLAGEMQSMALHPFVLLQRVPQGFLLGEILMESIAGIATMFFLRRLGIGRSVSLGAGIAFAFNAVFAWQYNASASPTAYLPLLLWGVEVARDAADDMRRRGGWALITVAIAGSLYAGFPETAYIDGLLVGVWCLVRLQGLDRVSMKRFVAKLAAGVVAGALLAAPVLVAFLDYLPHANVGVHSGSIATTTLPRVSLGALFMPYIYGPIDAFVGKTASANLGAFWAKVGGYLSSVQLMLALLTIGVRRLRVMQLAILAWFVIFLAKTYRFMPLITVVNWFPGMKQIAFFRYSATSVTMALLILAAFGAQRLLDERISRKQVGVTLGAVGVSLLAMAVYAHTETRQFVDAAHARLYFVGSFAFALGGATLVGAVAFVPQLRRRAAALLSLVAVEAALLFMLPQLSTDRMSPVDTAPVEFLRSNLGLQRFYTFGPISPNYGSYFGIASINLNDIPMPKAWSDYIVTHLDANANPVLFTGFTRADPNGPAAFFEFLRNLRNFAGVGTKYVLTNADPSTGERLVSQGLRQVFDDGRVAIFELPGVVDYFHTLDPTCKVVAVNWQSANVTCQQPSTLVRLELNDPGWSASRNGSSAAIATYGEIFQSVEVPAGSTRVTFEFAPQHITLAWLAAVIAIVWMVACPRFFGRRVAMPDVA
ncbi:MAG: hypothetical protein ACXV3B_01405 [Ilumatobacteraceae bacterium]